MMQRTSQTNSQPTLKSQMRLLYELKSTRQTTKITHLMRVRQVVRMKRRMKTEEDEEDEEDPEWDVIQEQVGAGKIKIKVQAGNHNKWVMQLQLKPYQAGRNFKPIFVVDITRD